MYICMYTNYVAPCGLEVISLPLLPGLSLYAYRDLTNGRFISTYKGVREGIIQPPIEREATLLRASYGLLPQVHIIMVPSIPEVEQLGPVAAVYAHVVLAPLLCVRATATGVKWQMNHLAHDMHAISYTRPW